MEERVNKGVSDNNNGVSPIYTFPRSEQTNLVYRRPFVIQLTGNHIITIDKAYNQKNACNTILTI